MAEKPVRPETKIQANSFINDIQNCLAILNDGDTILFPTDTIWGLGCDATNAVAVDKVLHIKQRSQAQGLIILSADENELHNYVTLPGSEIMQNIRQHLKPTTIIYEGGKNVAANILPNDKTLAIRLVKDDFCTELIRRFGKPIVSTSANIHGHPAPQNFGEIEQAVKDGVDYIVQHRQEDTMLFEPSSILKIKPDGFEVIRP